MKLLKKIFSIKTNKSDTNSGDHTAAINEVVDLDVQKVIESAKKQLKILTFGSN